MKVIIIGPAHPLRGGIADFNTALCKGFTAAGIESSIYSFSYQYPGFLFPGTSQFTKDDSPEGVRIHTEIHSLNPINWKNSARKIAEEKPDFVLVRYWLPFMAPCLGTICRKLRKKGIKVIAITDNVIPHEKRPGDRLLTGWFLKSCDAFIAMSGSVLDDIKSFIAGAKTKFLPHPVYDIFGNSLSKNSAREQLAIPQGRKVILFFGFIRAYKGLDLLLDAMADKRLAEMDVHLLVAGEFYEDSKPYMDQVNRNGLSDRVKFYSSYIPKEMVKYFFCSSDMVVQPYKSATQSGITQIAYHFDKPMLVTAVGGLPEIVSHGKSGYVTNTDPASIADAIFNFYDQNREDEFILHVQKEKSRFTWDTFVKGCLELYAGLEGKRM